MSDIFYFIENKPAINPLHRLRDAYDNPFTYNKIESGEYVPVNYATQVPVFKEEIFEIQDGMLNIDGLKLSKETILANFKGVE